MEIVAGPIEAKVTLTTPSHPNLTTPSHRHPHPSPSVYPTPNVYPNPTLTWTPTHA